MARKGKIVSCSLEDLIALQKMARSQSAEQRMVRRSKMILLCHEGKQIKEIAAELGERPNTIILWRDRYLEKGIEGLRDSARSGRRVLYGEEIRNAILKKLEEKPPHGLARWDGATLSEALNIPSAAIWRILRKEGIQLARQRSWCVSTDKEFTAKAADIVGLYLAPPENAIVICVDEKPSIQALSRTTGYVQCKNGKTVRAIKSTYRRNGTQNLFAALEVATGRIHGKVTKYKKRSDFQAFMDELLTALPSGDSIEYHVVLDNYCTHKRNAEWLQRHHNVFFHYTPTSASWLNQVEIWFNIMTRKVLRGASHDSVEQLKDAIEQYLEYYNESAEPFVWRKREVKGAQIRDTIANLCN